MDSGILLGVAFVIALLVSHGMTFFCSGDDCVIPTSPETEIFVPIFVFIILIARSIVFVASAVIKSHPNTAMLHTATFVIRTQPSITI